MENLDAGRMMQHYAAAQAQHSAYLNAAALDPSGMMMHSHAHALEQHHQQQQQQQHEEGDMEHAQQQQQSMSGQLGEGGSSMRGHADISTILDQIMNITDQSLDEAQVISMLSSFSGIDGSVHEYRFLTARGLKN